jgi:hypothetical protein
MSPDLTIGVGIFACVLLTAGAIGGLLTPLCYVLSIFGGDGKDCLACGLVSTVMVASGFVLLAQIA